MTPGSLAFSVLRFVESSTDGECRVRRGQDAPLFESSI